jgi:hypothetical protein
MLQEMLRAERVEKQHVLDQLVEMATLRLRPPVLKPGEKRDPPIMSPAVARATLSDRPTPAEIEAMYPSEPAADRRDIEAQFSQTGS